VGPSSRHTAVIVGIQGGGCRGWLPLGVTLGIDLVNSCATGRTPTDSLKLPYGSPQATVWFPSSYRMAPLKLPYGSPQATVWTPAIEKYAMYIGVCGVGNKWGSDNPLRIIHLHHIGTSTNPRYISVSCKSLITLDIYFGVCVVSPESLKSPPANRDAQGKPRHTFGDTHHD
jgi:hypothetical protein